MHHERNTTFKTSDFMRLYILKLVLDSCTELIQLYSTSITYSYRVCNL